MGIIITIIIMVISQLAYILCSINKVEFGKSHSFAYFMQLMLLLISREFVKEKSGKSV